MSSSDIHLINSIIESPVLLVIIVVVYLLFFLLKKIIVSVPDAVDDLKKNDDIV